MNILSWNPYFLKTSPAFEPLLGVGNIFEQMICWPSHDTLNNLIYRLPEPINTCSNKQLHFVQQSASIQTFTQQYEARVYLTGEVQTRTENWHDLFNALVWLIFPNIKAVLNQLHYQALLHEQQIKSKRRGALRDAVTLFDESGVIVVTSDISLAKLLKNFEWKALFWQQRIKLQAYMRFFVFGHGLYEKALDPYLGMTGKGIILLVEDTFFDQELSAQLAIIDVKLADFIDCHLVSTNLTPVPILGYPCWSLDNKDETYYDNKNYFRSNLVKNNMIRDVKFCK